MIIRIVIHLIKTAVLYSKRIIMGETVADGIKRGAVIQLTDPVISGGSGDFSGFLCERENTVVV